MTKKTLVDLILAAQARAERAQDALDALLWKLEDRAHAHTKALDPDGRKYLRFRVPTTDLKIAVTPTSVVLKGTRSCQGGGYDEEKWEMPLEYANGTGSTEDYLGPIRKLAKAQADAKIAKDKADIERRERAQLAHLKEKYNAQ